MTLDFYDVQHIKTIHHLIITRKEDGHKFIMKKIEKADDEYETPNIIIIDAETNDEVDNQTWEEINEEMEDKLI